MSIFKDIISHLGNSWNDFEAQMRLTLASDVNLLNAINDYLLKNSGKKIRPAITLLCAEATGGINADAVKCAAVVEMLHTATLLHDDVADNSGLRRGVPTVMNLYSPASSILAGDYWLSKALELLTEISTSGIIKEFTIAVQKLAEGEMFQMEKATVLDTTEEDYFKIIGNKTSSLFVAPIRSAAMTNGSSEETATALTAYAENIGAALQIRDDIFDYSPELRTGKMSGTDIREHKITLPLIGAIRNSGRSDILDDFSSMKEDMLVGKITEFVIANDGIGYAQSKLEECIRAAIEALAVLPCSEAKDYLEKIAIYLKTRKS